LSVTHPKETAAPAPIDCLVEPAVGAALVLLTVLVYSTTFRYPFVNLDDPVYVSQNPHVQAGLTPQGVRWAFTTFDCGNWHPLTWLSLQLDASLFGGQNAGGYHLTNVLLHAANTLLLFLVLGRMTGAVWRSALVAGLFALHPLHVESVAWVSERKDVLSTLFWMLALAAYLRYVRRPGPGRYLPVALALALGLLAKPMLVTLPCVLLLLDWWPLGRLTLGPIPAAHPTGARRLLLEKLPLFALALASCAVTLVAQLHGQAVAPLEEFPPAARVGNALLAYAAYLGKTLWPFRLAAYYPHPGAVPVAAAAGAGILLLAVTALVLALRRRPYLPVGWLWYLGTLVPVIGLVQVGGQAFADRYTYVPLIGVFVMLVWGGADLAAGRVPGAALAAGAALVLSACGVLTWLQVRHWQSSLHLWEHAVAVTPANGLAHLNLGACYYERGRLADARRELEQAAALGPGRAEPHARLATVLAEVGQWPQAADEYRRATALAPEAAWLHANFGTVLLELGCPDEALAEFRRAVALDPDLPLAHANLGIVLRAFGRPEEAEAAFRRAVALDPALAPAHAGLGDVLADLGRTDEARAEYRRALDPGDRQARSRLQACARLAALRTRLPDLAAGRDRPADNAERLALAYACRLPAERRFALAARLYAEAFAADPEAAGRPPAEHRFHAAAAAAAAGCGEGRDAGRLGEPEKARWRHQALEWLRADLADWVRRADDGRPPARVALRRALRTWQGSATLAAVRESAALAELPQEERAAWQRFWQDVAVRAGTRPP
jgi:Tfp pilus assembly protein PilF